MGKVGEISYFEIPQDGYSTEPILKKKYYDAQRFSEKEAMEQLKKEQEIDEIWYEDIYKRFYKYLIYG